MRLCLAGISNSATSISLPPLRLILLPVLHSAHAKNDSASKVMPTNDTAKATSPSHIVQILFGILHTKYFVTATADAAEDPQEGPAAKPEESSPAVAEGEPEAAAAESAAGLPETEAVKDASADGQDAEVDVSVGNGAEKAGEAADVEPVGASEKEAVPGDKAAPIADLHDEVEEAKAAA